MRRSDPILRSRALAERALARLSGKAPEARVVVMAGPGGNGGGEICAARHLVSRVARVDFCLTKMGIPGEANRRAGVVVPGYRSALVLRLQRN